MFSVQGMRQRKTWCVFELVERTAGLLGDFFVVLGLELFTKGLLAYNETWL